MEGILGITGTPGTGKKSTAPLVARALEVPCHGLNDLATSLKLSTGTGDGVVIDTDRLRAALRGRLDDPSVVYGHLLPYSLLRSQVAKVVVLRCEPGVLKQRLEARGYPKAKVLENVGAELIGTVSADSLKAFGRRKTVEVDSTRSSPKGAAADIVKIVEEPTEGRRLIDWLPSYDSGTKLRSLLEAV